jgi:hypothetical protein
VDRLKPHMQRNMARLEDGPNLDGEGLAAGIALVDADAGASCPSAAPSDRQRRSVGMPGHPAISAPRHRRKRRVRRGNGVRRERIVASAISL